MKPLATAPTSRVAAVPATASSALLPRQNAPVVRTALKPPSAAPVRIAKRSAAERPKFRRHPALAAAHLKPALPKRVPPSVLSQTAQAPRPAGGLAWLSVYAKQDLVARGQGARTESIPAQEVWVDGRLVPTLASGGWAAVPAGRHLVAFVPQGQSGFGRSPGVWVSLAPGAHVSRRILLPIASPILATTRTQAGPALTTSAAPVPQPPAVRPPSMPQLVLPVQATAAVPLAVGWYTVSGWIVRNATAPKPTLVRTSAWWVKVDGAPNLALALGQWAELPAGKHTIEFQPTHGVGVGPKTWDIDLSPQSHLDQQIPLPPMVVAPG